MQLIVNMESGIPKQDISSERSFLDAMCFRDMTHADIDEIIVLEKKIFPRKMKTRKCKSSQRGNNNDSSNDACCVNDTI